MECCQGEEQQLKQQLQFSASIQEQTSVVENSQSQQQQPSKQLQYQEQQVNKLFKTKIKDTVHIEIAGN